MHARLVIATDSYSLLHAPDGAWTELAVLPGGARALLPRPGTVDEASLENAIEVAEDWLMPHAARLQGLVLDVTDPSGRLAEGLREVLAVSCDAWRVEDVERHFLRLLDLTTGRSPSAAASARPLFVADVLLLRELAHHGRLAEIRFQRDAG